jgi:hypothetical protein
VSLHTIPSHGLTGRLRYRRAAAGTPEAAVASVAQPGIELTGRLSGLSMRILETGLAVAAIVTALLIGLGR